MNQYRKNLARLTVLLLLVGIVLLAIPFVKSLNFTRKVDQEWMRIDLADIDKNSYRFINYRFDVTQAAITPGAGWLIIRDIYDRFYIYTLPVQDKRIMMPKTRQGITSGLCKDFGPDRTGEAITSESLIKCNDKDIDAGADKYRYWDMRGKNTSGKLFDLQPVRFSRKGEVLVLYKR